MKILSKRITHTGTTYSLYFEHKDGSGGYEWDCDEKGELIHPPNWYGPSNQDNLRKCRSGEFDVHPPIILSFPFRQVVPAVGECVRCGAEVHLAGFTNTCDCGADYNMSGQLLSPRSQWGEETGESVSDILAVDSNSFEEEW